MEDRPRPIVMGSYRIRSHRPPDRSGLWSWRAWHVVDGKEVTIWTGRATPEDAEKAVAAIIKDGKAAPKPDARCETVRDVMELWLGSMELKVDLKPRSVETMRAACRAIVRELGTVRVDRITAGTLETFKNNRLRPTAALAVDRKTQRRGRLPRAGGMAPWTVEREVRMLRQAWAWACEQGLVASPTLPAMKLNAHDVVKRYTPTPLEVARVVARLPRWPALAARLLFATGCRLGEIAQLRRAGVDVARSEIHVDGKTGARTIPVDPGVLARLVALMPADPEALVLGVLPSSALTALRRHLWDAIDAENVERAKAGEPPMPRWTAHALRRLAVDRLYRKGIDVGVAASLMGHSADVALKHYRKASEEDRRRAVTLAALGDLPVLPAGDVVEFKPKDG